MEIASHAAPTDKQLLQDYLGGKFARTHAAMGTSFYTQPQLDHRSKRLAEVTVSHLAFKQGDAIRWRALERAVAPASAASKLEPALAKDFGDALKKRPLFPGRTDRACEDTGKNLAKETITFLNAVTEQRHMMIRDISATTAHKAAPKTADILAALNAKASGRAA